MYPVVKCQALATNDECSSENPTNCPKQALLFHLGSFWSILKFYFKNIHWAWSCRRADNGRQQRGVRHDDLDHDKEGEEGAQEDPRCVFLCRSSVVFLLFNVDREIPWVERGGGKRRE